MPNFQAQTATVQEMQAYSHCVDIVHPQPLGFSEIMALKVLFVIALIGMIAGFVFGAGYGRKDMFERIAMSFVGLIIAPCLAMIIAGVGYGIYWLFT